MTFEEAVDELYGARLEEFVAERKRLAKELGGDEGKELATLRKPSVAAWTLNQLAREQRRDVDLLLDAGHRMRQAGAKKQAFEEARAKEADALRRLTKAAEALGANAQTVAKVNAALRAAAVTEEGRERLALGRFVELPTSTGFEAYEGLELPKPSKTAARGKKDAAAKAQAKLDAAALREAEQQLRAAERTLHTAQADYERAKRRVEELRG